MRKKNAVTARQVQELASLKNKKGLLRPVDVVEFAKNKKTALHSAFEWDNGKAAHEYRLWQAQHLIVSVRIVEPTTNREIPMFVSLKENRAQPGGGYRETVQVLSQAELRESLLQQALADFRVWEAKYAMLKELASVFRSMEKGLRGKKRRSA